MDQFYHKCDGCHEYFRMNELYPSEGDCLVCSRCLYEEMLDASTNYFSFTDFLRRIEGT